jgi:arginase
LLNNLVGAFNEMLHARPTINTEYTRLSALIDLNPKIGIAKFLHDGNFGRKELDDGPTIVETGGLYPLLNELEVEVTETKTASLTLDEEKQYGTINRFGLAGRHYAEIISNQIRRGEFTLGLISNCIGLPAMLAGIQRAGEKPLRIGLVYFDAHADMNTPETTLSMMMGGMPVAISCGLCLERLRRQIGLEIPLPTRYVTFAGVRDVDPLEQEIIDKSDVEQITVEDIARVTPTVHHQMQRLSKLTDLIYIHVDNDVLNPDEVPGHNTQVPGGVTSPQLAACLTAISKYPKVAAFGVASPSTHGDPEGVGLKSAYSMVRGVVEGLKSR